MKDPRNAIERFCYRHPNFGVPRLMMYVAIANVAFWLLGAVNSRIPAYLVFDPYLILHGQVWRLVTFALYPPSTGFLAFIAIYFYYWIGSTLEQYWGTPQFNIYFFSGLVLTVVYGFLIYFVTGIRIQQGKPLHLHRDDEKQQHLHIRKERRKGEEHGQVHILRVELDSNAGNKIHQKAVHDREDQAGEKVDVELGRPPLPL